MRKTGTRIPYGLGASQAQASKGRIPGWGIQRQVGPRVRAHLLHTALSKTRSKHDS